MGTISKMSLAFVMRLAMFVQHHSAIFLENTESR